MVTMKSIKEKTEEYQETALKEKGAILRIDVRNAFKDGAYYVLDEIENFQKLFSLIHQLILPLLILLHNLQEHLHRMYLYHL